MDDPGQEHPPQKSSISGNSLRKAVMMGDDVVINLVRQLERLGLPKEAGRRHAMKLFVPQVEVKHAQLEGGELPQNMAEWEARIRDEWLKVAPYAWDYPTQIVLSELGKPGSGTGFGHILVTSKTALPPGKGTGQMGASFGVRTAKIPIIIDEFRLAPLDMIKTEEGAVLPLNEQRLGQALFRPTAYDIPGKSEASEVFGNPVYPPHREKGAALLGAVADTVHADQIAQVDALLRKDAGLREVVLSTPCTRSYVEQLANIEPQRPLDKTAALSLVRPDVVKVTSLGGDKYRVKQASRKAWSFDGQIVVDRKVITDNFGDEMAKEADAKGMVIIIRGSGHSPSVVGDDPPLGEMESMGPAHAGGMMGWVLPRILRVLTGDKSSQRLFTDGDHYGMQESIGARPADAKETPALQVHDMPKGTGVFCWDGEDGESVCTEPLEAVSRQTNSESRDEYGCRTLDGREVTVVLSPMTESIASGGGKVLVPQRAKWISIGDKMVKLPTVAEQNTTDQAKAAACGCTVTHENGTFRFDGAPLRKLGRLQGLSPSDALFTCGLLGFDKEGGMRALARAHKYTQVKLAGVQPPVLLEELRQAADQSAMDKMAAPGWQEVEQDITLVASTSRSLFKTAASLGDPESVDALLTLGFLNIDNVSRFITYIPYLEGAQKKMGILLLASRLGLSEMPQDHLSRAFFALEQILAGLRRLSARLAPTSAS